MSAAAATKKAPEDLTLSQALEKAKKRALGGGIPGAAAMFCQVGSLMWLRTTMNYQYRHGTTTVDAVKTLYKEGGVRRFYRGVGPALIQGPLSRFGDTAANAGVLALLSSNSSTRDMPVFAKTMCASAAAGAWRINLTPIDTLKTMLQVEGKEGVKVLGQKVKASGPTVLYHGALASAGATFAGHFPWFFTYNQLQEIIPKADGLVGKLARNAVIGFTSSVVSDTVSNSIRVVKTTKQTSQVAISYPDTVKMIIKEDGLVGLFGRGLKTRILTNGLQGLLFAVLWKVLQDAYDNNIQKNQ